MTDLRAAAADIFGAALAAADPRAAVVRALERQDRQVTLHPASAPPAGAPLVFDLSRGRLVVVGAGKAGAAMAQAVESVLGDLVSAGRVNVKYGHLAPTSTIALHEAAHPLPDAEGLAGTRAILDLIGSLSENDLVLCLLSGGGSSLLELPAEGVTLADLRVLTQALMRAGAAIDELNAVRKHLSQVKGGQLARLARPAQVISLILSDVIGSPLDAIASGPTVPDPTTYTLAHSILARYGVLDQIPPSILNRLAQGMAGEAPETVKPDDPLWSRVHNRVIADNSSACLAALERSRALGFNALLLTTFMQGEAREIAEVWVALAREIVRHDRPLPRPACLLAGGETTVTLRGHGQGGRNQEFALAAAIALHQAYPAQVQARPDLLILSASTDGSDGPTDATGAFADPGSVTRAAALGLDAHAALAGNNSYPFFDALGDLLRTGPTHTNVNDLLLLLVA